MSDRKAVNRYYPPDFDPQKHKSINKYQNSHPLRERAKKLSQGILVIRFEMPYNIWCEGCGKHVGMGVRYNAEKKKVGKYYTTPIYQFKMKCHLCDNYYIIETDPQNCDYKIIEGAKRKNQKWDMADNEQVLTEDREVIKKRSRDPMYKLEHGVQDSTKLKAVAPTLSQIADMQESWKDDYMQNKILRNKFREEKKLLKIADEEDQALLAKSSLDIPLLKESVEDKKLAALLKYNVVESFEDKQKHKRDEIKNRPLFTSSKAPATASTTSLPPSNGVPHIQDIKKRLGLDKVKAGQTAGFGDFESSAMTFAHKRTSKSFSNLGLVVKKKKKTVSPNVSSDSSSHPAGSGQNNKIDDKKKTNIQELSHCTGDKDRLGQPSRTDVLDSFPSRIDGADNQCGTNVQDLISSGDVVSGIDTNIDDERGTVHHDLKSTRPNSSHNMLTYAMKDPSNGASSSHNQVSKSLHHYTGELSSAKIEGSSRKDADTITSNDSSKLSSVSASNRRVLLCDYTSSSDSD